MARQTYGLSLVAGAFLAAVAAAVLCWKLKSLTPSSSASLALACMLLLTAAGILSGFMMLIDLAAAAWGMETQTPWGLGMYPYLFPALSLPAFVILPFASPTALARIQWMLTGLCAIAWYYGDQADRITKGLKPITGFAEKLGMVFNAFTLFLILISILVQLAAVCHRKRQLLDQSY